MVTQNINEAVAVTRARRTKVSFMKTVENVIFFVSDVQKKFYL